MRTPKKQNHIIIPLLISGLLFSSTSFGNDGMNGGSTLVLETGQYPAAIKKYNPSKVYLLYWGGNPSSKRYEGIFLREDTIINLKRFIDSLGSHVTGFRLIYSSKENIDSVWQLDARFRIRIKAYNLDDKKLHILAFDSTMKKTDEFVFNWGEKGMESSNTRGRDRRGRRGRAPRWRAGLGARDSASARQSRRRAANRQGQGLARLRLPGHMRLHLASDSVSWPRLRRGA